MQAGNPEALGRLVDQQIQILGQQVSVLDEMLRRLPYLFQVHFPAGIEFGDLTGGDRRVPPFLLLCRRVAQWRQSRQCLVGDRAEKCDRDQAMNDHEGRRH